MALILNLNTATSLCSVVLSEDGKILSKVEADEKNRHADSILDFIESALKSSGKHMRDLKAVSVSKGPGSYTGLRIGVSTAKGICSALNIPLLSVSTLKSMAFGALQSLSEKSKDSITLCPMIDARRMEVFCALYDQRLMELVKPCAEILSEQSFSKYINQSRMYFFGDGSEKCKSLFEDHKNNFFLKDNFNSAEFMLSFSEEKYLKKEWEDTAYFEPFYLKEFLSTTPKKSIQT